MVQEKGSQERCRGWTVLHAQGTSALRANAEAPERRGGKAKHLLISYFLGNTSAKRYRNWIVYVNMSSYSKSKVGRF